MMQKSIAELMFTVSMFGDCPAGNILGQELALIVLDSRVSETKGTLFNISFTWMMV